VAVPHGNAFTLPPTSADGLLQICHVLEESVLISLSRASLYSQLTPLLRGMVFVGQAALCGTFWTGVVIGGTGCDISPMNAARPTMDPVTGSVYQRRALSCRRFCESKKSGPKGPTEAIRAANIALADYLFVEAEPVVAGGGGIMFHVSARYFQFEPSCTMTLR
jgi:hypothetical protein